MTSAQDRSTSPRIVTAATIGADQTPQEILDRLSALLAKPYRPPVGRLPVTRAEKCKALQGFFDAVGGSSAALEALSWHLAYVEPVSGAIVASRNRRASGLVAEAAELIARTEAWNASVREAQVNRVIRDLEAKVAR